jgi:anti-anti-sigma factor
MQRGHEATCAFALSRRSERQDDDDGTTVAIEVLECRGEIDVSTAPLLVEALQSVSAAACIVDLGGVTFMGAAAVNALADAALRCGARGGTLTLRRPPRLVERLLPGLDLPEALRVSTAGG